MDAKEVASLVKNWELWELSGSSLGARRSCAYMVKREQSKKKIFDKSSDRIARLVDRIWLCRYPRCRYLIYDNGSEFKLHFEHLCD